MRKCPNCQKPQNVIKSGIINNRQRYKCKTCNYHFTVNKLGKSIDQYYVNKALQLYLEGLSYREIERLIGISHVSIMNWVKKYNIKRPIKADCHPTYKLLNKSELEDFFSDNKNLKGAGVIVSQLGNKFMMIKWQRYNA